MQVYENPASCNSFYKCENGTATAEVGCRFVFCQWVIMATVEASYHGYRYFSATAEVGFHEEFDMSSLCIIDHCHRHIREASKTNFW